MSRKKERTLQRQLVEYIRLQYPDTLFRSDLGGLKLPIGQAKQAAALQARRAWPDLFIAEPRGGYNGLFVELKATPDDLYTRSGAIRQTKHMREQAAVLTDLRARGYVAEFAGGWEAARALIDDYLAGRLKK